MTTRSFMVVVGIACAALTIDCSRSKHSGVGAPCSADSDCNAGPSTPLCVTQAAAAAAGYSAPGGYCTAVNCDAENPTVSCGKGALCLQLTGASTSGCYAACEYNGDCRDGYECEGGICAPSCTNCTSVVDAGVDASEPVDMHVEEDMSQLVDFACTGDACPACGECVPDCSILACLDGCNRFCDTCILATCAPQNTQGVQDTQGVQNTQAIQGVQDTQAIQGVQGVQDTQAIQQNIQNTENTQAIQQNIQNTENTQAIQQNIQNTENTQAIQQNIQNTENTQNIQNTENTQNSQNVQSSEDTQSSENTQDTECFDCRKLPPGKKTKLNRAWWKLWQ